MRSGKKLIAVQPLGGIREDVLEVIAANLQAFFQIRTKVFPDLPMLEGAYSSHRSQYNCHPILKFLGASKPHDAIKIIGVTDIDLFIPILTYVFGEAELGGNAAVISMYRLARAKDRQHIPPKQLFERAAKIAIHELAHTFHLPHCKEDRCIMSSFPVLSHIDERPMYFCRYCTTFLRDEYKNLGLIP